MAPHLAGGPEGKSRFDFDVDANKAVLDAAAYADKYDLWYAGSGNPNDFKYKAKVFVTNGPVGRNVQVNCRITLMFIGQRQGIFMVVLIIHRRIR